MVWWVSVDIETPDLVVRRVLRNGRLWPPRCVSDLGQILMRRIFAALTNSFPA